MAIIDDLNNLVKEKNEYMAAIMFWEELLSFTDKVFDADSKLQENYDNGYFEDLPQDVKATFNAWWNIIKTARDTINANQDILDVYVWRP